MPIRRDVGAGVPVPPAIRIGRVSLAAWSLAASLARLGLPPLKWSVLKYGILP
jgi:hypothetical protein